jgi:Ca2+-binding EF-hand superfamily protein
MRSTFVLALALALAGCGGTPAPTAAPRTGMAPQAASKAGIVRAFTAQAQAAMTRMDRDHDGTLARDEVDAHLSGAFDNIDTNADGKLTLKEMVASQATPEMVDYIHGELLAHFAEADADHDKRLDAKEFAWARENPIFYSSKLADGDFAAADRNHDGRLTASEFEDVCAATSLAPAARRA